MKLSKVMKNIDFNVIQGDINIDIKTLDYDSRDIEKGSAFIAIRGFKSDGHSYISNAVRSGAKAIICMEEPKDISKDITVITTKDTRRSMAKMASNFYNEPSSKLNLIGVTGTNGKTTTTYLIKTILELNGHKVGIIGTIANLVGDKEFHTERTTPESLEIEKLFSQMVDEKVDDVVMEVSSHSLDLYRVEELKFKVGIFTNLTEEHLDYHKTMEEYKKTKARLFDLSDKAVINIDDKSGEYMLNRTKGETITFAIDNTKADIKAKDIIMDADGVRFNIVYKDKEYGISLNIPGKFSIYNALGVIGACIIMGVPMETIIEGLKINKGVKGRFQPIKNDRGISVIVDYAHTSDSLENVLKTAREFVKGRIITVFGCGGDRDRTKRPVMGEIAGSLSDVAIITSDNPRTEEPLGILDEVEVGVRATACEYAKFLDRREAIFYAVRIAMPDDLIMIAGKGHEDYQIFPDKTIHFDDAEVAREALGEDI